MNSLMLSKEARIPGGEMKSLLPRQERRRTAESVPGVRRRSLIGKREEPIGNVGEIDASSRNGSRSVAAGIG